MPPVKTSRDLKANLCSATAISGGDGTEFKGNTAPDCVPRDLMETSGMVREAVNNHAGFRDCNLIVYTKGSYANNTNVKTDSDVDVGAQCQDVTTY